MFLKITAHLFKSQIHGKFPVTACLLTLQRPHSLCNLWTTTNYIKLQLLNKQSNTPHTHARTHAHTHTHTHTRLTALFPGLPGWASTRKGKPIWILLKHETVSGSGISWAICKSAPRSRQITTPAPHHSVFCRPDALPATQPTASKHWRHDKYIKIYKYSKHGK